MSVTISTKVPEELADRIDEAREEGENTSACVRRLIRAGLDPDDADVRVPPHHYAVFLGALLFLAPITDAAAISGRAMMGLGALLVIGAVAYSFYR